MEESDLFDSSFPLGTVGGSLEAGEGVSPSAFPGLSAIGTHSSPALTPGDTDVMLASAFPKLSIGKDGFYTSPGGGRISESSSDSDSGERIKENERKALGRQFLKDVEEDDLPKSDIGKKILKQNIARKVDRTLASNPARQNKKAEKRAGKDNSRRGCDNVPGGKVASTQAPRDGCPSPQDPGTSGSANWADLSAVLDDEGADNPAPGVTRSGTAFRGDEGKNPLAKASSLPDLPGPSSHVNTTGAPECSGAMASGEIDPPAVQDTSESEAVEVIPQLFLPLASPEEWGTVRNILNEWDKSKWSGQIPKAFAKSKLFTHPVGEKGLELRIDSNGRYLQRSTFAKAKRAWKGAVEAARRPAVDVSLLPRGPKSSGRKNQNPSALGDKQVAGADRNKPTIKTPGVGVGGNAPSNVRQRKRDVVVEGWGAWLRKTYSIPGKLKRDDWLIAEKLAREGDKAYSAVFSCYGNPPHEVAAQRAGFVQSTAFSANGRGFNDARHSMGKGERLAIALGPGCPPEVYEAVQHRDYDGGYNNLVRIIADGISAMAMVHGDTDLQRAVMNDAARTAFSRFDTARRGTVGGCCSLLASRSHDVGFANDLPTQPTLIGSGVISPHAISAHHRLRAAEASGASAPPQPRGAEASHDTTPSPVHAPSLGGASSYSGSGGSSYDTTPSLAPGVVGRLAAELNRRGVLHVEPTDGPHGRKFHAYVEGLEALSEGVGSTRPQAIRECICALDDFFGAGGAQTPVSEWCDTILQ